VVQPTANGNADKSERGSNKMGMLMIKCLETGSAIPTGIKMDQDRFRQSSVFFARTFCPICQSNHEWFARDAWVEEPRHRDFRPTALQFA
jgi:hypothetical protein